jgi:hypothetical protein
MGGMEVMSRRSGLNLGFRAIERKKYGKQQGK